MAFRTKIQAPSLQQPFGDIFPEPILSNRAPTTRDRAQIGQIWINRALNDAYILTSVAAGAYTWINAGGGGGVFDSITVTNDITTTTGDVIITAGDLNIVAGNATIGGLGLGAVLSDATGLLSSVNGTDGQVLIASTGLDPAWAGLTAGAGITVTPGAGSITIAATGATASSFITDVAGPVVPLAGATTLAGGTNMSTDGTVANTVTFNVVDNPTFAGLVTAQAGIDMTGGTATIEADDNAVQAIYLHTNAGTLETIELYNNQGTDVQSIFLLSDDGGIDLISGMASARAIHISAMNIASGIEIEAGTDGIAVTVGDGPINFETGTGAINVGADAAVHTVTVGSVTGAASTVIQSGTGDLICTSTDAVTIDCAGVLELNSSAGVIGIGNDAVAQNINIGTGAAARTITIGNNSGASSVVIDCGTGACTIGATATAHTTTLGSTTGAADTTIQAGTGALTLTAGGIFDVNATGAITIDSTGGTIGIGEDADAQDINIGTGAAARTITVGNGTGLSSIVVESGTGLAAFGANATDHTTTLASVTGVSATNLRAGTGALTVTAGGIFDVNATGNVTIDSTGGTLGMGEGADAQNINIGTGAAARVITIGNDTGATSVTIDAGTGNCDLGTSATVHSTNVGSLTGAADTTIQSGTGGITLNSAGLIDPTPATDTQASPSATSVINVNVGVATFTGFTTAAAATQQFTITNALVSATSGILVSIGNLGGNDARMNIERITPGAGAFTVDTINSGTQALNGNTLLSFWVLN